MGVGSQLGGRIREAMHGVPRKLRASFTEANTPRQVAGSFAIGVFITMLPTLGAGLLVMLLLAYRVTWINNVALFGSGIVINPPVKWGVYAASIPIGVVLLGPVEGIDSLSVSGVSPSAGREVLIRLLVGNTLLAVVATVVSYVVIYRMVVAYRQRETEVVEEVVEIIAEEFDAREDATDSVGDRTTQPATD